jgi:hypothetical protein
MRKVCSEHTTERRLDIFEQKVLFRAHTREIVFGTERLTQSPHTREKMVKDISPHSPEPTLKRMVHSELNY